ncbi:MAG: chemotaxis protein CheA, partial [Treponemataceae bacterium]
MRRTVDDDTKEIITSFLVEAYERLDAAEARLQKLGSDEDKEILNAVFRLFHSVKGSAGFLGFERIKSLTHEAEALLEVFIKEQIPCTQDSLDVVYQTIDVLRELVRAVEIDYTDEDCCESAAAQTEKIHALVQRLRAGETCSPAESDNVIFINDLVTDEMAARFVTESADLIDRVERDALELEESVDKTESVHSMFRAAHTIKGNAGFFGYSALESCCVDLEQALDGARKGSVSLNETFVNGVLARVDGIRALLSSVVYQNENDAPQADIASKSGSLEPVPVPAANPVQTPVPGIPPTGSPSASDSLDLALGYKPLGEILVEMGAAPEEDVRKALEVQEKPVGQLLVESGAVKAADVEKALEVQRKLSADRAPAEDIQRREIRVDTAKLDKLFDLVGELITAEAMVANSPDLVGLKLDAFNKSFGALAKISREIQETAMMIRMIPLEGLFNKMSRLVRDLSRKFNKPVDFHLSGEETEMDKNVIEQISDPMVHILRNALDHGIESAEKRKVFGKNEIGSLSMEARYEGSEIWISVKDDGAGLNRERILAKAVEKGLIKGDPALVSDKDAWALIFEPGFSTAEKVSDVSGRGVGMDVVKRNLEKIRGRVDIRTEPGKGSEFILQIPLTMAIIDGITVRVGRSYYSLPLNDIFEFFKARSDQITKTERGEETVNLRGTIMPL